MYAARPSPAGFGWFYKVVFAFARAANRQVSAIKKTTAVMHDEIHRHSRTCSVLDPVDMTGEDAGKMVTGTASEKTGTGSKDGGHASCFDRFAYFGELSSAP